jgi:hypothetical protein
MHHRSLLVPAALLGLGLFMGGCSSSREVQVTGNVTAAQGVTSGKVLLDFYDVQGEGSDLKLTSVGTANLDTVGPFTQKVNLEGENVVVRAIIDTNGDAQCNDGEAWGEQKVAITDDKADAAIEITTQATCPTQ